MDAMVADAKYLLTVEPDRLLHSFRTNAGLQPKGAIYGGWESAGLAGHSLGHYLSACAQYYATSKDKRYKERVDYIVSQLQECQNNRKDGYIAAMPDGDRVWAEVKAGHIKTGGFDLNGLWSPWYTHHKVLAGLLDAYRLAGNKAALSVAEKFADWAIDITGNLTAEQWQLMLRCEYGGMNEVLAELYGITGQRKYLDLAHKFYDNQVLDPLAEGQDDLPGKHSNTQIPKIIGLAQIYELTGDDKDRQIAQFFWDTIVGHHTYVIGGNSDHEYLGPPDKLNDYLSSNTCETCNTYNMLKLTRHLFEWDPQAKYADFYERAHLNDILASTDPETAGMCYFVPLVSGGFRTHSSPFDDWTCCHGTGMENHTKHADTVYFHSGLDRLYVTQFIPTDLSWPEAGIELKQTTNFPADGKVTIEFEKSSGRKFDLCIRHPAWACAFDVKVNGQVEATSTEPSSFTSLSRTWNQGDKVEFELPMTLRTEQMPDNPKRVAVFYGPTLLAADLGSPDAGTPRTPVLVTDDGPVGSWVQPVAGQPLTFEVNQAARPHTLTLKPFYALNEERYAVYFDEFTQDQWQSEETAYRAEEARIKDLQARTVDSMRVGEMQPERDHQLKESRTDVREANGRGFRTALAGGWFEFQMKVDPDANQSLVFTYWSNQRFGRNFSILVDGVKISDETLVDGPNNKFLDKTYGIPTRLTKGKTSVTVKVEAAADKASGSVSGVRVVKDKE